MANTIILKKSSVAGKVPLSTDLTFGEVALNYADGKIYYKNTATSIDFVGNGGTFTNKLLISDTTESTSTTTGALVVNGGVGIGSNLYVGGLVRIKNTTTNTTSDTGALVVDGGAGFGGNIHVQGYGHFGLEPTVLLSNPLAVFTADVNSYAQVQIQNKNPGTSASSDFIATADDGTDTSNYIDLGINSSQYNSGAWTISGARDGYLYVANNSLTLGTDSAGTTVKIHVGGTLASDVVAIFREPATATTSSDTGAVVINGGFGVEGDVHIRDTLHVGQDPNFALQNTLMIGTGNIDDFVQVTIQNRNSGVSASTDYVATADDGDDTTYYIDLGINSSGYNDPTWTISGARDGYLYVAGNNLTLGTDSTGTNVKIHIGGTFAENIVATFNEPDTQSTSTTTGAFIVTGGVGISGNLTVGGEIVAQKLTIEYTTVTTTLVQTDDIIKTTNNTQSTSTSTGALQVTGGAGIGGNLYVGGTINGNLTGTATNLAGGTAGQVPYQTTAGSTSFYGPGTAGQLLVSGGTSGPSYSNTSSIYVGRAVDADKWTTSRTLTLSGDLSGSVSFDGSTNFTLTATIAADSIVLGTDTTGDYVATGATSGFGLSGSTSGENQTFTVTSNATSTNATSTIVFRDGSGNFSANIITANLTGTATTATNLAGGALGSIPYQTSVGTTAFIPIGPDKFVLQSNGNTATWVSTSSLGISGGGSSGVSSITAGTDTAVSATTGAVTIWNTSTLQSVTSRGATTNQAISITNTTAASSTTTGALIVSGGVGIAGNAHIGGNIVVKDTAMVADASTTSVLTSAVTLDSFAAATYRSAQYLISISNAGLGEYQTSDILVVHNGTNSFVQATSVFSGNKAIMNFNTTISSGNVLLQGTGSGTGANPNIVKIQKTYITI